ncbi:MAG: methionine--tRNA ligase [Limnochordia bacterium]|nr:methionine--tRNA ligase [Bacillota bacterium]NLH31941.1 methionine--tRNA ligase [Bacillota bacterium]HOB09580.1 methionine--tRNA ligase [Limnochordia bacterium]HPZ31519.1 methionine--tRNA ligase [Limnochordia bacterium]
MERQKFYITTPIYYPSDKLHIGHAYTTVVADSLARWHKFLGKEVRFLTGSDEHGQKIQRIAQEKGVSPQEYVDRIVASFKDLWKRLNIEYDDFVRTTEPRHERAVQEVFRRIYEKGDIYKSTYKGWYCTPCETFWLESKLVDGNCPDCGRPVELVEEESYFFKMSKYADRLLKHIEEHPEFIQPESRRNEMVNFIKSGLEDLCVSRTTFDWGVPVPDAEGHVIYVWFDALTNYLTGVGFPDNQELFAKWWPADVHLMAKEILRFHSVIWPIILMALDLPLPKIVFGHGWLLFDSDKMSKSKGNVVDPIALIQEFGVDPIRYFLLREISFGQDGNFSRQALIDRTNADLANDLGNLLNRSLAMLEKYHNGVIPAPVQLEQVDHDLVSFAEVTISKFRELIDKLAINDALATLWQLVRRGNKYIDETAPWALAKDPARKGRLDTVMYLVFELLRVLALLLKSFIPETSAKIWNQLGIEEPIDELLVDAAEWGGLKPGTVTRKGDPIFPRIDVKREAASAEMEISVKEPQVQAEASKAAKPAAEGGQDNLIDISEFAKLELVVARVISAEKHPNADKLLKLKVDTGDGQRQIVAGIAKHYRPEELVGRNVIIVANLKPAVLRGERSEGMLLAATSADGTLEIVSVSGQIAPGSRVK